jgi:hypothetical protein
MSSIYKSNVLKAVVALLTSVLLSSCMSTFGPEIGMTEKHWLRTTLIADTAYMEGNVTAYRSYGAYYYFRDGILVKVDQGMIPAQQINMDITTTTAPQSATSDDLYVKLKKLDELRKQGILTEAEFDEQKQRLLKQPGK